MGHFKTLIVSTFRSWVPVKSTLFLRIINIFDNLGVISSPGARIGFRADSSSRTPYPAAALGNRQGLLVGVKSLLRGYRDARTDIFMPHHSGLVLP